MFRNGVVHRVCHFETRDQSPTVVPAARAAYHRGGPSHSVVRLWAHKRSTNRCAGADVRFDFSASSSGQSGDTPGRGVHFCSASPTGSTTP
jgi:hypothetical protein